LSKSSSGSKVQCFDGNHVLQEDKAKVNVFLNHE